MDKRNKLAALIIVCLCLAGIFQRNMSISYNQRAEDAAKRLYDYLCSYDFDGIDLDLSNDTVMLYEYVDLDGYPSTLEKNVVGTVKRSSALSDDAQIFQKIGRFGAGLLLTARINWAIGLEYYYAIQRNVRRLTMQMRYDINMLSGCNWIDVGRCADMIWWSFENGEKEYALHTQCSARVIKENTQILTREGIYYDQDEDSDNYDQDANSDKKRNTIFDFQANRVKDELLPLKVINVQTTSLNDIIIELEGDFRIEIFVDNPNDHEQWRMFIKDNPAPHLVAFTGFTEYQ